MTVNSRLPSISELKTYLSPDDTLMDKLFSNRHEERLGIELGSDQFIPARMIAKQLGEIAIALDTELDRPGTTLSKTKVSRMKKTSEAVALKVVEAQKELFEKYLEEMKKDLDGGVPPAPLPATPTESELCARLGMPMIAGTDWAAKKNALISHYANVSSDLAIFSGHGVDCSPELSEFTKIKNLLDAFYDTQLAAGTPTPVPTPTAPVGLLTIDEFKVLANRLDNPHLSPYEKLNIPNPFATSSGKTFNLNQSAEFDRMSNTDKLELQVIIEANSKLISKQLEYAKTESSNAASPFHIYSTMLTPVPPVTESSLEKFQIAAHNAIDSHDKRKLRAEGIERLNKIDELLAQQDYHSLLGIPKEDLKKIKPENILTQLYDRAKPIKQRVETSRDSLKAEINTLLTGICKDLAYDTNMQNLVSNLENGVKNLLAGACADISGQKSQSTTPSESTTETETKKSRMNSGKIWGAVTKLGKGVLSLGATAVTYAASISAVNWLFPVGASVVGTGGGVVIAAAAAVFVGVLVYRKMSK